jgi:sugar O-acyltransferase (sialic acid O-acetyltransferase NeuD family)
MDAYTPLRMPQSGPNDVTAMLAEWTKSPGQWVNKGELIASAETTKSVFDIEAPAAGYLYVVTPVGAEVEVGAIIAVLAPQPATAALIAAWLHEQTAQTAQAVGAVAGTVAGETAKPWTLKAELLAQRHGIDVARVPATGERISEADVQNYLAGGQAKPAASPAGSKTFANRQAKPVTVATETNAYADLVDDRYPAHRVQKLLIVGGGNGAVQILDALAKTPHQRAVGVVDDNAAIHGKTIAGVPVQGPIDVAWAVDQLAAGVFDAAVISISTNIALRARIFEQWKARGIPFANIIHPSVVVGMNVGWGEGNLVMALCHVGACATVGDNNFVSAYCSIEHHCILGSHCSFGPGVVTSSRVNIGDRVRFGTGIYIEPGVSIGQDSVIASGLAIWQNIPERSLLKARLGYSIRQR